MTWTKLTDAFAEDCARAKLTDAEVRVHLEGLIWAMRRETGGRLDQQDIRRGIEVPNPEGPIQTLVAIGWWSETNDGWQINKHMDDQTEPEVIAKRRTNAAERQRLARLRKAGIPDVTP